MDAMKDSKSEQAETPSPTPQNAESTKKKKQFEIDIYGAWCKSCGICAAFCPRECIRLDQDGNPYVDDADRCTGCGWCEIHCPDFAVSVRPRKPASKSVERED